MLTPLLALALTLQDSGLAARTRALMPVPRSVSWGAGGLVIDSLFTVGFDGYRDGRLDRAVRRVLDRLRGRTALSLAARPLASGPGTLTLRVAAGGAAVQGVGDDESYRLEVTPAGAALTSPTALGALRGLETFLQLVRAGPGGYYAEAVQVDDAPRFPWRGLLVDAGRHFMPPAVIRRTLDGMAAVKLNVLHWHLSEDQGFRVESRRYPRLQGLGADSLYYTQDDIRAIVAYARDRGIRVVPEFDMPGHAQSWFVGYPELASGPGPYQIERRFGVFDPVFDPTREEVYRFLDRFVGEMAPLFPDAYWHLGGDEVNGVQWNANPRIAAFKAAHHMADNDALQAYFNQRLVAILAKHGKRAMGWDEILHPDLPVSAVIQSWRGSQYLGQAVRRGNGAILSAPFYLDHLSSAEFHYLADPLPDSSGLSPDQQALVLGGEACMWAEHVSGETVDSRIWPRLAAVAERLWSPRDVRDVNDMYRRLWLTSVRLEELGLLHASHTGRMLRRLAGAEEPALVRLMSWLQPVSFGERGQLQRPDQLTPLTFAVDAARPDPPVRWQSRQQAARTADPATRTEAAPGMRRMIDEWSDAARGAVALLAADTARAPLWAQLRPATLALDSLAGIGRTALDLLQQGAAAPPGWSAATLARLADLDRPRGLLRLTGVGAVRQLVQAATP